MGDRKSGSLWSWEIKPWGVRIPLSLVLLGLLGVALLAVGAFVSPVPAKPPSNPTATPVQGFAAAGGDGILGEERALEAELERILSQMVGAGQVQVKIYLSSGRDQILARNETISSKRTDEKDATGGTRSTVEENRGLQPVISRSAGGDRAVVAQELRGSIIGVLVVAQGADDSRVKAELMRSVATILGLPSNRIYITKGR
ncbi:MAG: hypothetical protein M1299_04630 [Firmicutes bacterium]|nr:hypothetical protein [Bacillota bacterium]MCL5039101.1 hypothetical protein [Bacillota bacterium]